MALGAVLISFPFAFAGAMWLKLLHGWSALDAVAAYAGLGSLAFITVTSALVIAAHDSLDP